jgi:hypothetical protein
MLKQIPVNDLKKKIIFQKNQLKFKKDRKELK